MFLGIPVDMCLNCVSKEVEKPGGQCFLRSGGTATGLCSYLCFRQHRMCHCIQYLLYVAVYVVTFLAARKALTASRSSDLIATWVTSAVTSAIASAAATGVGSNEITAS